MPDITVILEPPLPDIEVTLTEVGLVGHGVPVGGTTNQVLAKVSNTDYDTHWVTGGTDGGGASQVPYGHKADYARWGGGFPAPIVVPAGTGYQFTLADFNAPDGSFDPAEGNLIPVMASDGSITFEQGALVTVAYYVGGTYDVAPLTGVDRPAQASPGGVTPLVTIDASGHATGDGATTTFNDATAVLAVIPAGGSTALAVFNNAATDLTVTDVELTVLRVG